ncbi:pectin lyase fold/virulence factor [Auriculariales sp. MPI-PUGE-AT-0066]|nr:pectin lyase fold/virulence factor [Auriculariales sp. MPI-PUGE-AT-0066]
MKVPYFCLAALAQLATAASSPPSGSITVGPSGSGAKYTTLTSALADTSSNVIFVYSGTYTGQTLISRANVTIYGQSSNAKAYSSNTVTFTNSRAASEAGSNDASGTIRIASAANNVYLYNLIIANTYGTASNHTQAIALSVQSTGNFACYACSLKGIQDTLLANQGKQFYGLSYIEGTTDFIFGTTSSIWIYGSTIQAIGASSTSTVHITASGRETDDSNWYVFDHSTIQGTGAVDLGRPWRDHARVVYQYCSLSSAVIAAGWREWSSSDPNTEYVYYGEYNNTGSGAWNSARASFATLMTSAVSISTVLGSTSWIDSTYLTT